MLGLVRDSVVSPHGAAVRVLGLGLPLGVAIEGILLVSALGGLLVGLLSGGLLELPTPGGVVDLGPLAYAVVLAITLGLGSLALVLAGRALGGHGRVAGAMAVVAWLQVVDLVLQVALVLLAAALPALAGPAALGLLGLLLWCLVGFVQALHGFGPGRAFGTILLAAIGLGIALAIVLNLMGLGVPGDV